MAKNDSTQLVMLGAMGFLAWKLADAGALGVKAKEYADKMATPWKGPRSAGPGTGSTPNPVGAPTYAGYADPGPMAMANPNIYSQMQAWQQSRRSNGEDAKNWNAFRAYLSDVGAPDPGATPPSVFASGAYLS